MCKYGTLAALRVAEVQQYGVEINIWEPERKTLWPTVQFRYRQAVSKLLRKVQLVICQISRFSRQFANATRRLQNLNIGMLYYSSKVRRF